MVIVTGRKVSASSRRCRQYNSPPKYSISTSIGGCIPKSIRRRIIEDLGERGIGIP